MVMQQQHPPTNHVDGDEINSSINDHDKDREIQALFAKAFSNLLAGHSTNFSNIQQEPPQPQPLLQQQQHTIDTATLKQQLDAAVLSTQNSQWQSHHPHQDQRHFNNNVVNQSLFESHYIDNTLSFKLRVSNTHDTTHELRTFIFCFILK